MLTELASARPCRACRGSGEEADNLFQAAFEKLKTGELVGAAGLFHDFARRFPHHPSADNAMLDEGIAYYGLHRFEDAIKVFNALAEQYPAGDAVREGAAARTRRLRDEGGPDGGRRAQLPPRIAALPGFARGGQGRGAAGPAHG